MLLESCSTSVTEVEEALYNVKVSRPADGGLVAVALSPYSTEKRVCVCSQTQMKLTQTT